MAQVSLLPSMQIITIDQIDLHTYYYYVCLLTLQSFYKLFVREGYTRELYIAGISKTVCELSSVYVTLLSYCILLCVTGATKNWSAA